MSPIINEDLALRLFPGQSAIGRRIGVGGGESSGDWHEIVGVVNDVRHHGLDVGSGAAGLRSFRRTLGTYPLRRRQIADA